MQILYFQLQIIESVYFCQIFALLSVQLFCRIRFYKIVAKLLHSN